MREIQEGHILEKMECNGICVLTDVSQNFQLSLMENAIPLDFFVTA